MATSSAQRYQPWTLTALAALAAATPHRPAVSDLDRTMCADELFAQAGGVAARLTAIDPHGTAPVPVIVDHRISTVVGLFGVLLAGRAFSAIERGDPDSRISEIIDRLGVTAVVAMDDSQTAVWPKGVGVVTVADAASAVVPIPMVAPNDLAAVVFTSGSTGRPKGVKLDHASFDPIAAGSREFATRCICDVDPAPHTFVKGSCPDSMENVEPPLWPGLARFSYVAGLSSLTDISAGCHLILRDLHLMSSADLYEWYEETKFRALSVVPSVGRGIAALDRDPMRFVRRVDTYGEALQWSDVTALRQITRAGTPITVNYGSSEAGGIANFEIPPDMPVNDGPIPLGVPYGDSRVRLEPIDTEPGSPLEIVVSDPLSAGYWDDAELQAARFGVDEAGTRFWRSGDLAEWVDGNLLHRGRVDDLLKISGVLVEPAEIERVLLSLKGITAAAVVGQTTGGRTRLVAHVQPSSPLLDPGSIRRALADRVAPALVPNIYVRHDVLPTLLRGKVDRQQLRHGTWERWRTAPYKAPRGELERLIVARVCAILEEVDDFELGRDDDLFEIGLDSLGVLELTSSLASVQVGPLEVADVMECPTPRLLALRCAQTPQLRPSFVLNADGTREPIWMVAGRRATLLNFVELANRLGDDQSLAVLDEYSGEAGAEGTGTVRLEAARHLAHVRTKMSDNDSSSSVERVLLAGHSWGGFVAYDMAQQLHRSGTAVELFLIDSRWTANRPTAMKRIARLVRQPAQIVPAMWNRLRPSRRYRPEPSSFPVTLVVVAGSNAEAFWRRHVAELTVVPLEGQHSSVLFPPYVDGLAEQMVAALQPR